MAVRIDDFEDEVLAAAAERTRRQAGAIRQVQDQIVAGREQLSDSVERREKFRKRVEIKRQEEAMALGGVWATEADLQSLVHERQVGATNDIVSIEFLEAGLLAKRAVGRIYNDRLRIYGTGFLVGEGLVMTNHHVIPNPPQAALLAFQLNYEDAKFGVREMLHEYEFDADRFFFTDRDLDVTVIAVQDLLGTNPDISSFGWHPLLQEQGKVLKGHPVNLIQHPGGRMKALVVHNSNFLHLEDRSEVDPFCWYSGDTEPGSSGAPVFNRFWEVVALHHKAVPRTNEAGEILDINGRTMTKARAEAHPEQISFVANEGIRASRISKALVAAEMLDPKMDAIRTALLELWSAKGAGKRAVHAARMGVAAAQRAAAVV